jgi:hypothetical protein
VKSPVYKDNIEGFHGDWLAAISTGEISEVLHRQPRRRKD